MNPIENLTTKGFALIFMVTGFFMSIVVYTIIDFFARHQIFDGKIYVLLAGIFGILLGALSFIIFHHAVKVFANKVIRTLQKVKEGDLSARMNIHNNSLIGMVGTELDTTIETLEAMDYHLYTDALTQLPNRLALARYYEEHVSQCTRHNYYIYVIDLDNFKGINDQYGHYTGDRVLQKLSQRIQRMLLPNERFFRFAGDEFVMVAALNKDEDIGVYTSKIKSLFLEPINIDGKVFDISMSMGMSNKNEDGSKLHVLLEKADVRMYQQKENKKRTMNFRRSANV